MWNDWLDRMERMLTSLWAESQVVCYLWAILMFGFRTFFSDSFTKAEANMRTMSRESLKASKRILHIAAHCCTTCNAKTVSVCERDWKRLLDATGCPWILLDATGNVLGMHWECTGNVLMSFNDFNVIYGETIKLLDLSSTEAWGDGSNKRSYAGWKLLDSQRVL